MGYLKEIHTFLVIAHNCAQTSEHRLKYVHGKKKTERYKTVIEMPRNLRLILY